MILGFGDKIIKEAKGKSFGKRDQLIDIIRRLSVTVVQPAVSRDK